jgi:Lon protease-like protein
LAVSGFALKIIIMSFELPIFPLGVVLFPECPAAHYFEPRYV